MFLLTLELLESCDCFYNYFCCCFFRFCFSSLNQWCLKPLEFARIVSLYFHCYCSILFSFQSSWILLLICFCFCHCCCSFIVFSKLLNSATQPRADVLQGFSAHSWELEEKLRRKKTISGIISRQSNLPSIHILWWEKASWLEVLCVWFLSFWIVRLLVGTWCAAPG